MKQLVILIVFILNASQQGCSQQEAASAAFTDAIVKKRINGKLCDSCNVASVVSEEYDFNFVITGAGHTPDRFRQFKFSFNYGPARPRALLEHTYVISQRNIGISFLPNFLQENGRKIQLYRHFGGPDYKHLEFKAEQNGKVIKPWAPLSALGEDNDYAIVGINYPLEKNTPTPLKRTFFAGNFNLNILDSLKVTVREIATKKLLETIRILRAPDTATNFIFYQVPVTSKEFGLNLQNVLNTSSDIQEKDVFKGESITIFKKDYALIGLLRFMGLSGGEVVQYSFEKKPYKWQSASSIEDERGTFIVLGNQMQAGKDHDVYLRYKSQPETIHKITIRVNKKPVMIPWKKIAAISIFLLAAGSIGFYLWNRRNKQKLAAMKRKNEDVETRLSLLSGQL
ncbi:MAG: hypothetical protein H7Y13_08750, partial [Sphingobacteriaceae bacterium]|nr:hypothetical protein [Sphingobacteriaceae bacterium]